MFVGHFAVALASSWLSGALAPPPPNIQAVAAKILVALPLILIAAWFIDRRRPPRSPGSA